MIPQRLCLARVPRCVAVLALGCALVATPGAPAGGDPDTAFAARHRELDAQERAAAQERARGPAVQALRRRAGRAAGQPERVEVLRTVRHPREKGEGPGDYRRRADVYVYDYDTDHLAVAVVDVETGEVESLELATGAQPPLSEAEVTRAMELLFADPASAARIGDEYRRVTGRRLGSWRQLRHAGFVFHADAASGTPETLACGRHRCAQLMLSTADSVSIEVPIVDLSEQRVLEARRFGPSAGGDADHGAHDHAH